MLNVSIVLTQREKDIQCELGCQLDVCRVIWFLDRETILSFVALPVSEGDKKTNYILPQCPQHRAKTTVEQEVFNYAHLVVS